MQGINELYILIGASGTGKTHYANRARLQNGSDEVVIASLHDFFESLEGGFKFDAQLMSAAHAQCFRKVHDAMTIGMPLVIVDNVNSTTTEMAPYVALAELFNYKLTFKYFGPDVEDATDGDISVIANVLARNNVHNTRANSIENQLRRLASTSRRWPGYWAKPVTVPPPLQRKWNPPARVGG